MKIYKVAYTPEAYLDLRYIYLYIACKLNAPTYAENLVKRIKDANLTLSTFPNRNKVIKFEPFNSQGIHKLIINNYASLYIIHEENNTVEILRIFYSGRDISPLIK